ncbi:hypothetical protein [Curtobacterium sp. MCSS17_016]|uniref:hypothetical protein n=1 Tax=Curtobacterium sp. MCSS17_016 TaxID=2175644 RepID=UPI000DA77085|nr:hypothetical protein [Curtobacterium sp. MCSS17_016]WIE81128.1 hypothetical protein DEJ19_021875 [Curtobacterium sp. MCSS17_016]
MTAAGFVVWVVVGVLLLGIVFRFVVLLTRIVAAGNDRSEGRDRLRHGRHADDYEEFLSD